MILPYFNANRYDLLMSEIDFSMFGVNPTVWLESFTFPALTEILYLCYFIYFPMPFIILIWLYKKNMLVELESTIFAFFVCYYGAYVMYFFIPVMGPRFFLADIQTIELNGLLFSSAIKNLILALEPNKLDAFPSLHAAIVMVTMLAANKYNKKIFNILLPLAIAIIFSLTYLRYHYVIDIIAGLAWAVFSWFLAKKIFNYIGQTLSPHFGK
ncbi:MAG: phosphatase PAP2 family protein [Calditrichaeota bacterium]|nr:phosphatase PAP2 family protein [Calditrichota bacterium]